MKTVDRKEQDDEFEGLTIENIQDLKRSQLQSRDTHEWLMKRHTSKVKKRYLFFPEEIKKQLEVKKIFQNFDRDGSNFLDMDELYDMFQKNGFRISEEQLQQFFTIVDEDKDSNDNKQKDKLSWPEFKKTAFNAKAAEVFMGIMKTLRAEMRTGDTPASRYMPLSFNNMISYLSFLASREELQTFIDNDQVPYVEKFKKYQEMIHLNQQFNKHEEPEEIHKSAKLLNTRRTVETEKEFVRKTEYQFQKQKDSCKFMTIEVYQAQTRSTPHKNEFTPVHTATTPQNNKLPRQLKEIDAILKSHQTPSTKYITQQKEIVNNSIKRLKQDVNQYINLAKHQYNINVDDMQVNDAPKQPIKLQIRSFETEFKNSLQNFKDDIPSFYEPKIKNLPIIEEKSKTLTQGTDLIPAHLLKELRKSHNRSTPNIGLKTFFKTTSDFTRLLTSTTKVRSPQKNQYIATPVYQYEESPAETYHPQTSHVTTSCNQFRMSSQYALHRNSFKKMKQFLDVKPILGKSLLK